MRGKRVYPGKIEIIRLLIPGEYGKTSNGIWWICTPNGLHHKIDNKKHKIIEHEDNTITICSILLIALNEKVNWKGFLEKGIWRRC